MSIYKENIETFSYVKDYLPKTLVDFPKMDFSKEKLLIEPEYGDHSANYLALDILSDNLLNSIISKISDKSLLICWYLDATSLQLALETIDFTKFESNLLILCGHPSQTSHIAITESILKRQAFYLTTIKTLIKCHNDPVFIKNCREIIEYFRNYLENFKFVLGNSIDDTLEGLKHNIINFPAVLRSTFFNDFIKVAKPIYKGKPALIVASGPSLDKNIDQIKRYANKALILSCDGSLSGLHQVGVKPDIVASVERGLLTYEKFYKGKKIDEQVFFGPSIVHPNTVRDFESREILCVKANGSFANLFNSFTDGAVGEMQCGGSVAHTLMHLAEALECDPIILTGQDLAFTKEGISHTSTAEVKEHKDVALIDEFVEGINGDKLPSTRIWKMFLNYFEETINERELNVIDASEGGAKISGTKVMTLAEALEESPDFKKPNLLQIVKALNKNETEVNNYQLQAISKLDEFMTRFIEFNGLLESAIKQNTKAFSRIKQGVKTQAKLDKIYDAVDYVAETIVEAIISNNDILLLFQYPLRLMYTKTAAIDVSNFSIKTIEQNLEVHKCFLDTLLHHNLKLIRLLIECRQILIENFNLSDVSNGISAEYLHLLKDDDLAL